MQSIDEKQQQTAQWLVDQAMRREPGPDACVQLAGYVGSGKTAVLYRAVQICTARGINALFIGVPSANIENAAIVLSELTDRLEELGCLNGQAELMKNPEVPWSDKVRAVTQVVNREPERFMLICDEPHSWAYQEYNRQNDLADTRIPDITRWIFREAPCRRIISGKFPDDLSSVKRPGRNPPRLENWQAILVDADRWASAADRAAAIPSRSGRLSTPPSILSLKVLVAIAWLMSAQEATRRLETQANLLLEEFLDQLDVAARKDSVHQSFCQSLAKLAMARSAVNDDVFGRIVDGLDRPARDIIRNCLCSVRQGDVALHPFVRHRILARMRGLSKSATTGVESRRAWNLPDEVRASVHQTLFAGVTETAAGPRLRRDIDAFYHGALRADAARDVSSIDPLKPHLHFQAQLEGLGFALSYYGQRHRDAVKIFRKSLSYSDHSAYSHHYLAFNLDWLAESTGDVEKHYQQAIELHPTHPWYWSRWISYLVTRGQWKRAKEEWLNALEALNVGDESTDDRIYQALHQWVARWSLHWGHLTFAREVLYSIPQECRDQGMVTKLFDLLEALELAEDGLAVFPLTVRKSEWWSPRPHTDLPVEFLERWRPARVQHVDEDGRLFLQYGEPSVSQPGGFEVVELEMSRDELESAAYGFSGGELEEGDYVELGYYGTAGTLRIGLHRAKQLTDPELTRLIPPPNRWFDRAVEQSWNDLLHKRGE